jgi:hypothetical protein
MTVSGLTSARSMDLFNPLYRYARAMHRVIFNFHISHRSKSQVAMVLAACSAPECRHGLNVLGVLLLASGPHIKGA